MGSFLGIKYHSKLSDNEYLTNKKSLSGAWEDLNGGVSAVTDTVTDTWDTVTDTVTDTWDTVTDTVQKTGESVYNAGTNALNSVTKEFGTVVNTVKKYWYVPAIVGGLLIGVKVIGTANSVKLLKSLTN